MFGLMQDKLTSHPGFRRAQGPLARGWADLQRGPEVFRERGAGPMSMTSTKGLAPIRRPAPTPLPCRRQLSPQIWPAALCSGHPGMRVLH